MLKIEKENDFKEEKQRTEKARKRTGKIGNFKESRTVSETGKGASGSVKNLRLKKEKGSTEAKEDKKDEKKGSKRDRAGLVSASLARGVPA